jgi:hypothetical protein
MAEAKRSVQETTNQAQRAAILTLARRAARKDRADWLNESTIEGFAFAGRPKATSEAYLGSTMISTAASGPRTSPSPA